MHLPRQRRRLQRTAFAMLLVWLFALASSVAQACVTPMPVATPSQGDHCALMAQHHGASADTQGGNPAWKAACAKFCSDTTLPSAKASTPLDSPAGQQSLGAPPALPALAMQPERVAHRPQAPPDQTPPGPQSSIPIAFLRLAL